MGIGDWGLGPIHDGLRGKSAPTGGRNDRSAVG